MLLCNTAVKITAFSHRCSLLMLIAMLEFFFSSCPLLVKIGQKAQNRERENTHCSYKNMMCTPKMGEEHDVALMLWVMLLMYMSECNLYKWKDKTYKMQSSGLFYYCDFLRKIHAMSTVIYSIPLLQIASASSQVATDTANATASAIFLL